MNDVIIIGGGPAGSSIGCYLSMLGISNTIFESDFHPRPHVGESLVPSTTRVFKDIGFLQTLEAEDVVRKYGAAWHPPCNRGEIAIEFCEFPQDGIDQTYTYHVDRGKFDLLLLKHAHRLGSAVHQGVHVKEVLFENAQACGVRIAMGRQTFDVPCRMVVDATGRKTLLGRQLKLKKHDPIFNQFAVHAWFQGVDRGHGATADFIHIYFLPVKRGWAWQIPITDSVTSVGVVAEREVFQQAKLSPDRWFKTLTGATPDITHAMRCARPVNDFKMEADYSYSMDRLVGNGYVLIGDAARFVDPIFSSGVSVALYSAKFASESIQQAFKTGDFSAETFSVYEKKLRRGAEIWYEFIRLYYKLLPAFTYFIQSKKHRLEVLQLLQGDVYDRGEVRVLDDMRRAIAQIENAPSTPLWASALMDIPID